MSIFNRRKKKTTQDSTEDRFLELFTKALEEANENAQKQRPILLNRQYVWEPNYGLDKSNPIISDSLEGTAAYLSRLCTSDGKTFTWSGYTSIRAEVYGLPDVGEDRYTLYLDGQPYSDVYFVPYVGTAEFPPAGLGFTDDKRDWNEERLVAKYASELGVDRETAKELMALKAKEKDRSDKKAKKKKEAEREISILYPSVNINEELKTPLFKTLFDLDFNSVMVYEYVHSAQLLTRKKQFPSGEKTSVPNADYYHRILFGLYRKELENLNKLKCTDEIAGAKEIGIDLDTYRNIRALKYAELKEGWNKRESQIDVLSRQAVELKKKYPDFCLEEEIQNELFVKLIDTMSLQEAFEVIHFSDCFERNRKETDSVLVAEPEHAAETSSAIEADIGSANEMLFCRKCGKQIPFDSIFCSYCGTEIVR